jgi:hypothetical protein
MTPSGPTHGKIGINYTFTSNTIHSDGDMIYYWFDWDDGDKSGWIGPYTSGETVEASHKWTNKWTIADEYSIQVKAMDGQGRESECSDPLEVTMPKNRAINGFFLRFLEQFPILQKILLYLDI